MIFRTRLRIFGDASERLESSAWATSRCSAGTVICLRIQISLSKTLNLRLTELSSVSLIFYISFYIQLFTINLSLSHHLEELTPAYYFGKPYRKKNPTSGNPETYPQVLISHHRFLNSGEDYKWGLGFEEVFNFPIFRPQANTLLL